MKDYVQCPNKGCRAKFKIGEIHNCQYQSQE